MATIDVHGLVDPSTPLDPAAQRVLAARELQRLGPTPGDNNDPAHGPPSWVESVRAHFHDLTNETGREILECVLDPTYTGSERPDVVDRPAEAWVAIAIAKSGLPDTLHSDARCSEVLPGTKPTRIRDSRWNLTVGRRVCHQCVRDPSLIYSASVVGVDRHRVDIRSDVLSVLFDLKTGSVAWPAIQRLAALSTPRWRPRVVNGFIDKGNPVQWPEDPICIATVELAVAVGHATGQHLAAVWDAAMIEVLAHHARSSESSKTRKKAQAALTLAVEGHTWETLSAEIASRLDTKRTRKASIEKRATHVLSMLEPEIADLVGNELAAVEVQDGTCPEWTADMARENATNFDGIESRLVMAWYGGALPAVIPRALRLFAR